MKKHKKKKQILASMLSAVMFVSSPMTAVAGYWQAEDGHWKYMSEDNIVVKNQWKKINENWYHFDSKGNMETGWILDKGNWYYLNCIGEGIEGAMRTGWYQDPVTRNKYYLKNSDEGIEGSMHTGWYQNPVTKKWYYLNRSDEGIEGSMRTGWYQDSATGKWYWLEPSEGKNNGVMQTGWIYDGTAYYYMGKDGAWIPEYRDDRDYSDDYDEGRNENPSIPEKNESLDDSLPNQGDGSGNQDVIVEAKANVIAFDNTSEEGLEELEQVYEGIMDYWTDDMGTEDTSDDEYNVVVANGNPMYSYILDGTYQRESVIYIPACEYFPTGVSLIYQSHDDAYKEDMEYDSGQYEVIHTKKATLGDLIDEEISLSSNEIDEENPIAFMWTPEYEMDVVEVEEEETEQPSLYGMLRNRNLAMEVDESGITIEQNLNWGQSSTVKGAGLQLHNLTNGFVPVADFTNPNRGKVGLNINNIILYDKDGKKNTTYDRIVLSGELALKDISPEVVLDWNPQLADPLPKQFMAKLSYVEENNIKVVLGGEIGDLKKVYKALKEANAARTHNNRRSVFGMDIEGVDMSDSIIIGAVGVNIASKTGPKLHIKALRDQSIKLPLTPTFLLLFLLDIDGNISATVVGEYHTSSYLEKGINVQKEGYIGDYGTCEENRGQKNFKVAGRNINIYDLKAKSKDEKDEEPVTTFSITGKGNASVKAGIGAGGGIMMAGIIPFMVKGTAIGLEASATMDGKASVASDTGLHLEGKFSGTAAIISKVELLLRLTTRSFLGKIGIEGNWELKHTWLQLNLTTQKLQGQVLAADMDRDNSNNARIAGAAIELKQKTNSSGDSVNRSAQSDSQGKFEVPNLPSGKYEMKVVKNGYITYESEIEVGTSEEPLLILMDKDGVTATVSGTVKEADTDTNHTNNDLLSGVTVTITKPGGSTALSQSMKTGADGTYQFTNLPMGLYEITFEKTGYIDVKDEIIITSTSNTHNAAMEIISNSYQGKGIASGVIVNALTGRNVGAGIKITVTEGRNISNGDVVSTTETNNAGRYSLELPAGVYTLWLKDTGTPKDYADDSFNIKILGNATIDNQNGEMTPLLEEEEIRIVLMWGETPYDLDSHITGPEESGGRFHVFYGEMNEKTNVNLDVDDTTSYGPETITIHNQQEGIYQYAIHDYSNRHLTSSMELANSGAYVRVYRNGHADETFMVPYEEGTVWNVFNYDSTTNEIIPVNMMGYEENPGNVAKDVAVLSEILEDEFDDEIYLKEYERNNMSTGEVIGDVSVATNSNSSAMQSTVKKSNTLSNSSKYPELATDSDAKVATDSNAQVQQNSSLISPNFGIKKELQKRENFLMNQILRMWALPEKKVSFA